MKLYTSKGRNNIDVATIEGIVVFDGGGNPSKSKGLAYTVTKQAAGHYRITTNIAWHALIGFTGNAASAAATKLKVELKIDGISPANRYFDVLVSNETPGLADPASGNGFTFCASLQTTPAIPAV